MNFRERFEAWHRAKFGYCTPPDAGHTAFDTHYSTPAQQQRWEGWQACSDASYDLGVTAGRAQMAEVVDRLQRQRDEAMDRESRMRWPDTSGQ